MGEFFFFAKITVKLMVNHRLIVISFLLVYWLKKLYIFRLRKKRSNKNYYNTL